jgi:hypothetical protein
MTKDQFIQILKDEGIDFEYNDDLVAIKGLVVWLEGANGVKNAYVTVEDRPCKGRFYTTNDYIPATLLTREDMQPMIDKYHKCFG